MPRGFFDVRQNGDSTGDRYCFQLYWTKLCVFDVFKFFAFCLIFFLFMHCVELSHASHVLIFESTHKLQVRWGTNSLPYDLNQGLSLCKPQLFAECLD
jgi:hypothetical protein